MAPPLLSAAPVDVVPEPVEPVASVVCSSPAAAVDDELELVASLKTPPSPWSVEHALVIASSTKVPRRNGISIPPSATSDDDTTRLARSSGD